MLGLVFQKYVDFIDLSALLFFYKIDSGSQTQVHISSHVSPQGGLLSYWGGDPVITNKTKQRPAHICCWSDILGGAGVDVKFNLQIKGMVSKIRRHLSLGKKVHFKIFQTIPLNSWSFWSKKSRSHYYRGIMKWSICGLKRPQYTDVHCTTDW